MISVVTDPGAPSESKSAEDSGSTYKPLKGVRVVDMSRLIVGAITTRNLADLGAEVVKIEDPVTGDYLRSVPPMVNGYGVWHHLLNRNKRSVALRIDEPEGKDLLLRLIQAADVVVEVSLPDSLRRLGIDIAELRRQNPKLVVCSITGFGQTGEWSRLPAHGMNLDALAGASAIQTLNGQSRFIQLVYTSLANEQGAANAGVAILASLLGVRNGGEGAWIDISCWDSLIDLNRVAVVHLLATGLPVRESADFLWGGLHSLYLAKDGKFVFFAALERKFWERFCKGIGRPDLLDLWESDTSVAYGDLHLRTILEPIFASWTSQEWERIFVDWEIPGSPVLDLDEVMSTAHFAARKLTENSRPGELPTLASPIRFVDHGGGRPGSPTSAPPSIGQDTESVLSSWLGNHS